MKKIKPQQTKKSPDGETLIIENDYSNKIRDLVLSKAYLHPDMVVAEISSEIGGLTSKLASLVKQVIFLVDSNLALDKARETLLEFNNVDFRLINDFDLPLSDSSQDTVFISHSLRRGNGPSVTIEEIVRVLRPGGRLVLVDLETTAGEGFTSERAGPLPGFGADQIKQRFESSGLVNVIVDSIRQPPHPANYRDAGQQTPPDLVIAIGTKRIVAQDFVQASYGARALEESCDCGDSSCCSPEMISLDDLDTVHWDGGYSSRELSEIPVEAASFSLGCGNPIAMANLQPGEIVLDIGSGGGIDVFLASKQVGTNGYVYGIDMTESMLARARKTAEQNGITNVEFRQGYAENLPVDEESVDVVISNCVINLTEDKGKVFREAYRVIKPGGRLEVNDTVFSAGVLPAIRTSQTGWAECISGALPEGEYIDLVRQAGFQEITVRRSTSSGTSAGVPIYSIQVSAKK